MAPLSVPTGARFKQELLKIPARWLCVLGGILLQISFDFTTAFVLISHERKNLSGLNLNTLSLAKDVASNFRFLAGVIFCIIMEFREHRPNSHVSRFGMSFVIIRAVALLCVGYVFIWLDLTGKLTLSKAEYHVCTFVVSHSSSLINTANVMASLSNFPNHRGMAVALLQGFFHLSSSIFTDFNTVFFDGRVTGFVIFMACVPTGVSIVCFYFMRFAPSGEDELDADTRLFTRFYVYGVFIAVTLSIMELVERCVHFKESKLGWLVILVDGILVIGICSPIFVKAWRNTLADPVVAGVPADHAAGGGGGGGGVEMGWCQVLRSSTLWAFALSSALIFGCATSIMHNIDPLAKALNMTDLEVKSTLSLWSLSNFVGSLLFGYVSDVVLAPYGWGRPWLIVACGILMMSWHMVCTTTHLCVGLAMVGVANGGQLGLLPTIAVEVFTIGHLGIILPVVEILSAACSFVFSLLALYLQNHNHSACSGNSKKCFFWLYVAYATACLVGSVLSLVLGYLTQGAYNNIYGTTITSG